MNAGALTIGEVLQRSTDHLAGKGAEQPRLDAERLLGHALGLERIELYMHLDRPLSPEELAAARMLVSRRATGEPLQYVLGEWGFRGLVLAVDRRALIPRPETEVVVERCLALLDGVGSARVLDVGTGSGAIALAIAGEHPGARVTGIDVSDDALALARLNAERTGIAVELRRHDLFEGLPGHGWDLVVSNPPYIRADEVGSLAGTSSSGSRRSRSSLGVRRKRSSVTRSQCSVPGECSCSSRTRTRRPGSRRCSGGTDTATWW